MKKISILISIIITLGLLLATASCNAGFNEKVEVNNPQTEGQLGSATFNIVVPDYYALAGVARAIPPQATHIKLYYKKSDGEWNNNVVPIALSAATKTNMTGAPDGTTPPAAIYTCTFTDIPSKVYPAGDMRIEVLTISGSASNQSTTVLSSGTNTDSVHIVMGETTSAAFFTIPVDEITTSLTTNSTNPIAYNLAAEQMKFLKKVFNQGSVCTMSITRPNVSSNYPDIVVFDDKGRFVEYVHPTTADSSTTYVMNCGKYSNTTKYFGFWFAEDENEFNVSFAYTNVTATNALFQALLDVNTLSPSSGWIIDETTGTNGLSSLYNDADGFLVFDYHFDYPCDTAIFRDVTFDEDKIIKFQIKTNIGATYDGSLKFYIDNDEKASFTGINGVFRNAMIVIPAGTHNIMWCKYDPDEESMTNLSSQGENVHPTVTLKNFSIESADALSSINQTFESAVDANMWIPSGLVSEVINEEPTFAEWAQYEDALVDTHGKVYKLGANIEGTNTCGNSYLAINRISVSEESAVSFDYKCDLYSADYLRVYIDNEAEPAFETTGSGQIWQNKSVILSKGIHTVRFAVERTSSSYSTSCTNAVYLDNITLAPNRTDSVGIYPKGVQETYVNGDTIQFTAKALRSDGTAIDGKTVTWTTTSGSISSSGLFTPDSLSGNVTVRATIDGKTAYNNTVVVHGANYLSDSVTLNGHTFTGAISSGSGTRSNTTHITWANPTPNYSSFTADGFFVLKGHADGLYGYVKVTKKNSENPTYVTTYFLKPGDFEQRIWLRFGQGEYDVSVYEIPDAEFDTDCGEGYEGDYRRTGGYYTSGATTTKFTVTNSTPGFTHTAEECAYLMPSYICQSDDFVVSNAFNAVIAELPSNATLGQKLQALYDWELHRTYYDKVSLHDNQRKVQDAVHVIKYGMAVCEGYANLYAAFTRLLGLQTAYQTTPSSGMNHAWIECKYNNVWKLVDPTWDDPVPDDAGDEYNDRAPTAERYKYFFIDTTGIPTTAHPDGDHYGNSTDYSRMVIPVQAVPVLNGVPNGWY